MFFTMEKYTLLRIKMKRNEVWKLLPLFVQIIFDGGSGSPSTALSSVPFAPLWTLHIPGPAPLSPLTHSAFQEAFPRFRCFLTSVHQNYLSCGPHPQGSAEWMNCSSLSSVFYVYFPILNLFVCLFKKFLFLVCFFVCFLLFLIVFYLDSPVLPSSCSECPRTSLLLQSSRPCVLHLVVGTGHLFQNSKAKQK